MVRIFLAQTAKGAKTLTRDPTASDRLGDRAAGLDNPKCSLARFRGGGVTEGFGGDPVDATAGIGKPRAPSSQFVHAMLGQSLHQEEANGAGRAGEQRVLAAVVTERQRSSIEVGT